MNKNPISGIKNKFKYKKVNGASLVGKGMVRGGVDGGFYGHMDAAPMGPCKVDTTVENYKTSNKTSSFWTK
jgi:hypothetical protein